MYVITEDQLKTISLDHLDSTIRSSDSNSVTEFYGLPGKEHYRLLSHLSSLFQDSIILDIGTHRGSSALALSSNSSNIVHSFDIVDKVVNNPLKHLMNIEFHHENLLDPEVQSKWKDTILKSAFMFLDIDPHNGKLELEFYHYLKEIGYQGFVVYDDIWYFKEMRDHFWYNIPEENRFDLTHLGHWSGTGIVTFNDEIKFEKRDNSMWTLVTAYFNLTKCPDASVEINKRGPSYYVQHSISTLSLPYNLVIYCDKESHDLIYNIRPEEFRTKTKYIVCEFDEFVLKDGRTFRQARDKINQNRVENPYQFDNRNTASYYLFCLSRYIMLKETIDANPFKSTHFSWINFCIERMGYQNLVRLDEALSIQRNKFSTCYIDYIPESLVKNTHEYFRYGRCGMCSGFFTGNSEYMYKVCDLILDQFLTYLEQGYGHADEQLYSPVYFANPELFEHYYGDYQEMITNYRYIYDSPEPPIYNFIGNSFKHGNYKKCLEACEFVWNSYCLDKCVLNESYLGKLCVYYMKCQKQLIK